MGRRVVLCAICILALVLCGAATQPSGSSARGSARPSEPPRKVHERPREGQMLVISIRELGNFEYDMIEGGTIPPDVRALSGVRVRLNGFMMPLDQADNITRFALVPDLFACCYGQPPGIQHTIMVRTPKGKALSYFPDEILVEGTLTVEEKREDDLVVSLFEVECTSVKPAPR
jgi:hypothetical protein